MFLKRAMQTNGEVPRPAGSARNLRQQQFIELWVGRVGVDHSFDHSANKLVE